MWNQLVIDSTLDHEKRLELAKQISELRSDINNHFAKNKKQIRNLIEFNDGLFVWNPQKEELCYIVIRNEHEVYGFQTMLLSNPPMSDIFSIKLYDQNGKYLLLSGQKVLVAVELPRKYGNQFFYENEKSTITVKSWTLLERLFICNEKIKLLETKWHPGSIDEPHVFMLTNDNFLRLINIFDACLAVEEIKLPINNESMFVDYSFLTFANSLGETAVSFDFGPPTIKSQTLNTDSDEHVRKVPIKDVYWPIYILKGSGDVLLIYTSLINTYVSKKIYGPLRMLPYAEDNYGVDGCSIVVINSNPSLVVIATSTGLVHHCFAVESDSENEASFLPNMILHVFESIQLTLSLTSSSRIDNNCHIMLLKNQTKNDRYFCMHMAGIHAINVPFIQQLSSDIAATNLEETIVEHLICTKPIASTSEDENFVPSGLSLKFHKGFLLSILLSSGEFISQKLSTVNFIKKDGNLSMKKDASFLEQDDLKIQPIDFHDRIKRLLQRESSTPLIKSKHQNDKFEFKEGLQFILNTTEKLKKEYLAKFDSVSELIDKRIASLQKEKDVQCKDLANLKQNTDAINYQLASLSSKYDSTLVKQEQLSTKIESVVDKLMKKQTSSSEAEVKLMKNMNALKQKIEEFRASMNQVKLKQKYQEDANCAAKLDRLEISADKSSKIVTEKDIVSIEKVLKQQSKTISILVSKINFIKQHSVLKNI